MKQHVRSIGEVPWTQDELRNAIPEFLELYNSKPITDNQGGMKSPHMFATWFMLKKLNPSTVIESGVWKGQGTWLIEKTLPGAKIHSIDIKLGHREYISDKVTYYQQDFNTIDWSEIGNKEDTVLFFDDHQNAVERISQAAEQGFKHCIFEDNYPAIQGDCYSLKKAFMHAGFKPVKRKPNSFRSWVAGILIPQKMEAVPANPVHENYLKNALEVYYEFPPVYQAATTRWGDAWEEENYPTEAPLFADISNPQYPLFAEESPFYTWICYAKLK